MPDSFSVYFQQPHAIDVLRALHHIPHPQWKLVKKYAVKKLKLESLSDNCYRKRCKNLVKLGLAEAIHQGGPKRDYHLTQFGHKTATIMEQTLQRIEKWRIRALKHHKKKDKEKKTHT